MVEGWILDTGKRSACVGRPWNLVTERGWSLCARTTAKRGTRVVVYRVHNHPVGRANGDNNGYFDRALEYCDTRARAREVMGIPAVTRVSRLRLRVRTPGTGKSLPEDSSVLHAVANLDHNYLVVVGH